MSSREEPRFAVRLTTHYKLYNAGEVAGFHEVEARYIVDRHLGVYVEDEESLDVDLLPESPTNEPGPSAESDGAPVGSGSPEDGEPRRGFVLAEPATTTWPEGTGPGAGTSKDGPNAAPGADAPPPAGPTLPPRPKSGAKAGKP